MAIDKLQNLELVDWIKERHEGTVLGALDIEYTSFDPESVTLEVEVTERLFQHAGVVHGGVYVLLAESAASTAAALSVNIREVQVRGMAINANHLRAVQTGRLVARATPIHRGRSSHVYGIDVENASGDLVSVARCTIAVVPDK
jgi:1,4-dihydroxy-2-naphthoyl-CoA hydrolase